MERLRQRLRISGQALGSLLELTALTAPSRVERDAAIQRFEYTVEAIWKTAQLALAQHYGMEVASPKPVVRACAQNTLLNEADARAIMDMIDDRNLTSHTYNEELAIAIHSRLPAHADLLGRWLDALQQIVESA